MASLLGPGDIRFLAESIGMRPTKQWGQNFVVDPGTVKRIVKIAGVTPGEHVVEVGPGLGSLTLALLDAQARVTAVEIDPALAAALPGTAAQRAPREAGMLTVINQDALTVTFDQIAAATGDDAGAGDGGADQAREPTALVANLPYNVSVPVILHFLEHFPGIERILVMVQAEVADRLAEPPGTRTYGIPSAKAAWYASVRRAGNVKRNAFWPVPRVDSALLLMERRPLPLTTASREEVFVVIDAAFAQRRKAMRASLRELAGSTEASTAVLEAAGIEPLERGEKLGIGEFARIAEALAAYRVRP